MEKGLGERCGFWAGRGARGNLCGAVGRRGRVGGVPRLADNDLLLGPIRTPAVMRCQHLLQQKHLLRQNEARPGRGIACSLLATWIRNALWKLWRSIVRISK